MLDQSTLSFMESRFGFDFSLVRIHTDAKSEKIASVLGARAFTMGRDVIFNPGYFQTGSNEGRKLIAHELVHVLQQSHVDNNTDANVKQTESSEIIQRYVSPLDWVDYLSLGYDVGENIYLTFFYEGKDKEFQQFLNLFFTAVDLIMAATPGAGGGGVVARASHGSMALAWDALPTSAKAAVIEQVAKGMGWGLAKTTQAINMLMRGKGSGGRETSEPKTAEPKTAEPKTAEPKTAEPKTAEPKTAEPKTAEPNTAEPKTAEPKTAEPKNPKVTWSGDALRREARAIFFQVYPKLKGKVIEVHHRIPLEWKKLFPSADPNRISNLQGLTTKDHLYKASQLWESFRNTFRRLKRSPTAKEVLEYAGVVDRSLNLPRFLK